MEINQEWIAQQRAICDAATPGPWEADEYGDMVWAKNPYGHDLMRVADIRGWGHLTGSGACALPQTQAQGIQNANQVFIAAARTALPAAIDALEASIQREAEKDAVISSLTAERDTARAHMQEIPIVYQWGVTEMFAPDVAEYEAANWGYIGRCPICGEKYHNYHSSPFCPKCGQRLKWVQPPTHKCSGRYSVDCMRCLEKSCEHWAQAKEYLNQRFADDSNDTDAPTGAESDGVHAE